MTMVNNGAGYDIPLTWTPGEDATFVVLGALGTPAPVYRRLVEALSARGWGVALVEQRGMGQSAVRPSHDCDWDFTDVVGTDLAVVLDWVREQAPDQPLYVLGHSLGGHYAQMLSGVHPDLLDGLVLVACGSPWIESYDGETRQRLVELVEAIPALHQQHGYYPGRQVGFGGDDSRGVMADWRHLAQTDRYRYAGDDSLLAAAIATYAGRVLVIRMADDDLAPQRAVQACVDRFRATAPEQRVLSADQLGGPADHFGWAKVPSAVVELIEEWVSAR